MGDAQDDIDSTNTTIRRLDRTNEELSSQCEGLQVQVEHLTSRLRSGSILVSCDFLLVFDCKLMLSLLEIRNL